MDLSELQVQFDAHLSFLFKKSGMLLYIKFCHSMTVLLYLCYGEYIIWRDLLFCANRFCTFANKGQYFSLFYLLSEIIVSGYQFYAACLYSNCSGFDYVNFFSGFILGKSSLVVLTLREVMSLINSGAILTPSSASLRRQVNN